MSRKDRCVRKRRRKAAEIAEEFVRARERDRAAAANSPGGGKRDDGEQWAILRRVARSGVTVAEVARLVPSRTEDESAMFAQAVDPRLAGCVLRPEQRKREQEGLGP